MQRTGGKAAHIAELMGNRGAVIARDVHEHKIKLIKEAAGRLGIDIIKTEILMLQRPMKNTGKSRQGID
jgi:16S rRNA (cytosine967-C5)-methyltransferase